MVPRFGSYNLNPLVVGNHLTYLVKNGVNQELIYSGVRLSRFMVANQPMQGIYC